MIRMLIALLVSFAISAICGPMLIPFLRRLKFGQSIREDGPTWHEKKSGTPTMGGIMFILSSAVGLLITGIDKVTVSVWLCAVLFGAVGFLDDYIKVVKKRNLGLSAKAKFLLQALITVLFLGYLYLQHELSLEVQIPFSHQSVYFGVWLIPFAAFVLLGTVNSVNLTDGLDGLAATTSLFVAIFFASAAYQIGASGIVRFMLAVAGGTIGFLIYNHYPAKVFMGDTGSLFLGGAIGAAAIAMDMELFLVISGAIFLWETLTVILQVLYFKSTKGKRLFKMAPFHHHLEMCGYKETKIVLVFSIITVLLCLIAYFGL